MGFHSTNTQMAIEVATRQGCDVLAASAHPAMPRFGRLAHVWVLTDNGSMVAESHRYRVTELSINEDGQPQPEFGQGIYRSSLGQAQAIFEEQTKRSWQDWTIHNRLPTDDAARLRAQGIATGGMPRDLADDTAGAMETTFPEDRPHDQLDDPWNQ